MTYDPKMYYTDAHMVLFKAKNYIDELDLIIKNKFEKLETEKKLAIVQVGNNKANQKYVEIKAKIADEYGIELEVVKLKASVRKKELYAKITELSDNSQYGGIIIQYPVPAKFDFETLSKKINPAKDVDFFTPETYGKFALDFGEEFMPPTVRAFDFITNTFKLEFKGKNVLVLGQGRLVGRPFANYLLNKEATVFSINEYTEEKEAILKQADVLICASGQPNSIKGNMLKRGACVVDFSFGSKEDPGVGDFDTNSQLTHLNIVAGVPGGIGPLTVRFLFLNFLEFVERESYF